MKLRKLLLAAGVMALTTTSCTDLDDHSDYGYAVEPNLTGYITGQQASGANVAWTGTEELGIFVAPAGQGLGSATSVNRHYKSDASGNFTPASESETVAFPGDGSKVDFFAYLPYQATADNGTYLIDVTDQTDPRSIDLLYAKNAKDKSGLTQNVRLGFSHQLTHVVVAIVNDPSITSTAGLTVTLTGTPTTAKYNLANGKITDAGAANDIALQVDNTGVLYTGIAIPAAPSASTTSTAISAEGRSVSAFLAAGATIKLTLNGQEASVALDEVTLKSGDRIILPVRISDDGTNFKAELGKVVEGDWTGDVDAEINYEFPEPGDDLPEETEIFYESMGAESGQKVSANTAISAFTGWDNKDLTFTNVSGGKNLTVRCPASIGFNSIWFPAGINDFSISGFELQGYTKFTLEYQVACNGTGQDIQTMMPALNGVSGTPDSFSFTATNKFSDAVVEIELESGEGTGEIHFTTDASNTKGLRLAKIRLTGHK